MFVTSQSLESVDFVESVQDTFFPLPKSVARTENKIYRNSVIDGADFLMTATGKLSKTGQTFGLKKKEK